MKNVAFGPIAQGLAFSALNNGLGDSLVRIGMDRQRLVRAAERTAASECLSPREVGALAYAQGLSGEDTAFLAFGSGRAFSMRPSSDRVARMSPATPKWWADPVTRVADLGDGMTREMIGASLGLDIRRMDHDDPLPVPADTRFAALAKLVLGDHWDLGLGIKDQTWIGGLNQTHQDIAVRFLLTKDELAETDDEQDLFHQVPVTPIAVADAPEVFGGGVGMVVSAGASWFQLYVRSTRGGLEAHLAHLNQYWREAGRGKRFGIDGLTIRVSSLAEVGRALLGRVPEAARWQVVALRFPSGMIASPVEAESRKLA